MSILLIDSAHAADGSSKYSTFAPRTTLPTASPSGRSAYQFGSGAGEEIVKPIPDYSSVLVGYYGYVYSLANAGDNSTNAQMFRVLSDTLVTVHLSLGVSSTGEVWVRRGGGTGTELARSSAGVITAATWHHWEVRATIADAGGRVEVWIDGTQRINFTGDTKNAGTKTVVDGIRWGRTAAASGGSDGHLISDIVISNGTTPIGPTTVWRHLPNGNGNSSQLLGSDGNSTDNYLLVDEATPDGDTTYVSSATEGQLDLYALDDLPSGAWDVLAVQTALNAKTDDGGSKFLRPVIRSGGSNAVGTSRSLPASYASHFQVFETNPVTTNPWTEAEVDALEVGPEVRDS